MSEDGSEDVCQGGIHEKLRSPADVHVTSDQLAILVDSLSQKCESTQRLDSVKSPRDSRLHVVEGSLIQDGMDQCPVSPSAGVDDM
ncbi:unnamed protein product [Protopolystoma xenopodis]|uniref:Uncharacterized protein n=1 Tax=Protopolystoma xenopodis TaxID=117903 RepID=A0A3S5BY85_9PLAT|nr:unnamed protein product [Protopolystoma xenopodis]